jgi:uncharacterized protein
MALDKKLLEIIACPKCKKDLKYTKKPEKLTCQKCNIIYKIKDNIPNMLIEEAALKP